MNFLSLSFAGFGALVFAGWWGLPAKARPWLLAAANLVLGLVNLLEFSEGNWEIGLVNLLIALLFCWGMRRTFRLFWKLKKQQDLEE